MNKRNKIFWITGILIVGIVIYNLPLPIPYAQKITLSIFAIAALLWMTEVIPLYATAFVIVFLETLFLRDYSIGIFFHSFFEPVIIIFLGGFVLASAFQKYGVDKVVARIILERTPPTPFAVLLSVMFITAILSMWMSNTATTALMIGVLIPILKELKDARFKKGLILSIPFAANIGGIATPIGTPPNAIAIGILAKKGVNISFLKWMQLGLPITIFGIILIAILLYFIFRPTDSKLSLPLPPKEPLDAAQKQIIVVSLITILLWLTGPLHGYSSSVIALIPVVIFFGFGYLKKMDFNNIGWDILILVGGGLALGTAMQETGLSSWIISQIDPTKFGVIWIIIIFTSISLIFTTFMSNSATANLLIPLMVSLPCNPFILSIIVAVSCSFAMALPISTPPNAIAYGSGEIKVKDMAVVGVIIEIIALVFMVFVGQYLIKFVIGGL
ncbi:SLC13/DASS family transporter [candidate division WOR-3 bacterium]|nr:SLC13/DASS family transporter [candidate division WOR-3 bacterium]MCK4528801.1 SLC13/DASS family transporter [candidate division WOR-3 bacterium]